MAHPTSGQEKSYPRQRYFLAKLLVQSVYKILFSVTVKEDLKFPSTGPVLVVANHLSYLDIPFLGAFLPRPAIFISKGEVMDIPVLGWLLRSFGTVGLRRGQSDRRAIRQSLGVLNNGDLLVIFPEGTRSRDGKLLNGQPGVGLLARRSDAMLAAAAITGTESITIRSFFRKRLTLRVGAPIPLAELVPGATAATAADITKALMYRLAALLPPQYQGLYACEELRCNPSKQAPGSGST